MKMLMKLLLCYLILSPLLVFSKEQVILQLKWFHQFQFAGYYAAKEKGFYEEQGLNVTIKQRDLKYNNIQEVIDGKAQYGIADSVLLLYKANKQPVVIVSPIFQHSPGVLISIKNGKISSPYDIKDDTNMLFYPNDTDGFALLSMLKKLEVTPNLIRLREKNDYKKLLSKEVDLMPAYLTNEPFYFQQLNTPINIINPMHYGFDLYGDILFANEHEAKNYPKRVEKFKQATLKGWEYALENKEEIIQVIHEKYNSKKSLEHLRFEAKAIEKVIAKDIIPLGYLDRGRIRFISNLYKEYGLIKENIDLKSFIFEEYKHLNRVNLTKEEQAYLLDKKSLMVQNMMSFPPYNFFEDGKPIGYSIDYMKLIGKYLGINVEFKTHKTWAENLKMLQSGQIDIMPHVAINDERKTFMGFTKTKVFNYVPGFAVIKDFKLESMKDLENKTIAVLNKSFVHTILKNKFPNQKLLLSASPGEAVNAVFEGKADAVLDNVSTLEYYIQKNWIGNLKTVKLDLDFVKNTPLHIAVSKDNVILKSILEKVTNAITVDEAIQLKQKWVNLQERSNSILTAEEIKFLNTKKELNYCIAPKWIPYEKIEKGKHIGITSDYIRLFQEQLPIPLKLKVTQDWSQTVEYAKSRQCDIVTVMVKTDERAQYMNFSTKYLASALVIATTISEAFISDIKSVLDKKFGIVKGYAYKEILKDKYPSIQIVDVNSAKDGLERVRSGELFGYIDALPVVGYTIQKDYATNLKITGQLQGEWSFSLASRNDEPLLNSIFSKLIESIPLEKRNSILNKWISVKYQESVDYTQVIMGIIVFLVIIGIILYKNRSIQMLNSRMQRNLDIIDKHVITSSTDAKGIITYASQEFCNLAGYTKEELVGKPHSIVQHEDMSEELYEELWQTIKSGNTWKGEIKNKKKNGDSYWVISTISPRFDKYHNITGYTSLRHDITDKKIIEQISITDGLTNIYNRRHFNDIFPKYINSAKRHNEMIAFLIMDVDHFKQYNDTYGHQKGDEVLISIAKVIKEQLQRSDDYCFRLGGEEFGIIFKPTSHTHALLFANTIKNAIEQTRIVHEHNSASKWVTASMGLVCTKANEIADNDTAFKQADDLLYKAKDSGRNRVCMND